MKRAVILACILCIFCAAPAYSYWVWTPKSGRWINPKTEAKPTPKEQFEYAKEFYDAKSFEDAKREFSKLVKRYPKSFEASEGQYYLALIDENKGALYEAYLAFQKVIDTYPFSERIQEIIEREYKIAEKFMAGEKRKAMGVVLPVENPAIEIFTKVIENSTYGSFAPAAQYKLGLVLKGLLRYYEAEDAFNKVISSYPLSEWVAPAKFQLALTRAAVSRGPDYDQAAAKEAKDQFEEFVKEHPDAVLSREAEKNIAQLRAKEAESKFTIARFYERQGDYAAAKIYYEEVISNYSDNSISAKAVERLSIVEKIMEKKRR